jgi:hypothetical protein
VDVGAKVRAQPTATFQPVVVDEEMELTGLMKKLTTFKKSSSGLQSSLTRSAFTPKKNRMNGTLIGEPTPRTCGTQKDRNESELVQLAQLMTTVRRPKKANIQLQETLPLSVCPINPRTPRRQKDRNESELEQLVQLMTTVRRPKKANTELRETLPLSVCPTNPHTPGRGNEEELKEMMQWMVSCRKTAKKDASFRYGRPDLGLPSTGKPHRKQRANDSQQLLMTPVSQVRNPLTEMNTTLSPSTNAAYSPFISDVCQKRVGVEPPHSSISTAKMTAYDPIRLCSRDLWADVDENHCPSASTVSSKVTHHSESSEREVPPDPLPTTNSSCLKNTHVFQCLTPLIDASLHFCPTDCSNSEGN